MYKDFENNIFTECDEIVGKIFNQNLQTYRARNIIILQVIRKEKFLKIKTILFYESVTILNILIA